MFYAAQLRFCSIIPLLPERAEKLQSRFSWKRERDALNAGDVMKH